MPIASKRFVFPWPFGPIRKTRSLSKTKFADSMLRKFSKLKLRRRKTDP
jgi:hypothetical protein